MVSGYHPMSLQQLNEQRNGLDCFDKGIFIPPSGASNGSRFSKALTKVAKTPAKSVLKLLPP